MKEWRGNIVTLVQNTVVRRVRVSCKQTYTSPPNDNGCDGILSSVVFQRRSQPKAAGKAAIREHGTSGAISQRARIHIRISITYIFASLSRENVTLSQTHEGGARAPHTPRHENRHAAGLTRRVTNHLTAPAATFQPPFNTLPRPQDKLCLVSRRGKELLRNRIAFPSNRILIQRGYDLWPVMLEKSNYLSGI